MAACSEVGPALDRYLDREAEPSERAGIERHLGECAECARLIAERRAAMGMLAEWAAEGAGAPPAAREVRPKPVRLRLALAVAAAAALVAVAAAWHFSGREHARPGPASCGHRLTMRSMDDGVTVVPGAAGEPDELVVDAFPVQLCWQPMSSGVNVVQAGAGEPDELVVDPFPVTMRTMSSGVVVVSGKAGEPAELVVDPFPEEGM